MNELKTIFFLLLVFIILLLLNSCQDFKEPEQFKRYCKAADLVADTTLEQEYLQLLNDDLWQSIVKEWKKYGVADVQIYKFKKHLLMILDTELDFDLQEMESEFADSPEMMKWVELSKKYFKPLPQAALENSWVLIERVYKLDQEKDYKSQDGYVERKLKEPTKRLCEMRQLVDDTEQIEAYKYHHALGRAWPEITQGLKNAGIKDMEIYMAGNRTFKIFDVVMDFDIKSSFKKTRTSKSKEWGALVGTSDRPFLDKDGKRMSQFMERIF